MSAVTAWRMEVAPNNWVAVAEKNLIEYISDADLTYVPLSPKGCNCLLKWKNYQLPVIDISSKLNFPDQSTSSRVAIIYIQNKAIVNPVDAVISLRISAAPERLTVNNDQMSTEVSLVPLQLQSCVCSLFYNDEKLTAVYDWRKLLELFH